MTRIYAGRQPFLQKVPAQLKAGAKHSGAGTFGLTSQPSPSSDSFVDTVHVLRGQENFRFAFRLSQEGECVDFSLIHPCCVANSN